MAKYDKEVGDWLTSHNAFFLFFWGLCVVVVSLAMMPFEIAWYIRNKIKGA